VPSGRLTELFGQYVPPELVEEMNRDPTHYSMEGRSSEMTVLFADVRGFTTLAEGMPPDELARLMNDYFSVMTDIIRAHRGTLDKYVGDAAGRLSGVRRWPTHNTPGMRSRPAWPCRPR
jgi:adenylate cyclase